MVFSSLAFLYLFLPVTLLLYAAVSFLWPAGTAQAMRSRTLNTVLLLCSLAFYFCGEQLKVLVMVGEIALAYAAGLLLVRLAGKQKKAALGIFLSISLALLCFFKYSGRTALPIGISFYTFQCMSYVIDVYRGDYPAEKDPLSFALYVSFFPQLIAGPVVRYHMVSGALKERPFSFDRLGEGALRFSAGLGKKVLIADRLYAFASSPGSGSALAWAQSAAYLLYVYFDFSGYSDMAIGLAKAFGFDIPENFSYPLISRSVKEFWRRWHISLGSWFRDYVYIPLGGSRRGLPVKIRNLLAVWTLTGMWHGASLNFAVWGLFFGILLALESLWERRGTASRTTDPLQSGPGRDQTAAHSAAKPDPLRSRPGSAETAAHSRTSLGFLRIPLVLFFTVLGFVFFRFTDLSEAFGQFRQMFSGPFLTADGLYLLKNSAVILAAAFLGATPLPKRLAQRIFASPFGKKLEPFAGAVWMLLILLLSTASLVNGSFSPFLYFRF